MKWFFWRKDEPALDPEPTSDPLPVSDKRPNYREIKCCASCCFYSTNGPTCDVGRDFPSGPRGPRDSIAVKAAQHRWMADNLVSPYAVCDNHEEKK